MPTNEEIEAATIAIMIKDNCGYSVDGKRVRCDDKSIGDKVDDYGTKLMREECDCRTYANTALEAAEKVREDKKLRPWVNKEEKKVYKLSEMWKGWIINEEFEEHVGVLQQTAIYHSREVLLERYGKSLIAITPADATEFYEDQGMEGD